MLQFKDEVMIFKCLNGLVPEYSASNLLKLSKIHVYSARRIDHITFPICEITTSPRSLF